MLIISVINFFTRQKKKVSLVEFSWYQSTSDPRGNSGPVCSVSPESYKHIDIKEERAFK